MKGELQKAEYGITVFKKSRLELNHSRQAREDIEKLYSFGNIKS
jgi:hypothetical protein